MRKLAALAVLLLAFDTGATSPLTFEDPDGQALELEELSVRTAVHGMLSLTELDFRFRNPQDRRIEGRFSFTLPPDAAISRFAKDVNGHLMEGEVVERLRANQVYEQFLHQMRDPALLEQDQGNRFSARIFPIEPKAPVRLVLSYTQLLPLKNGARTYSLPLRGLPEVGRLTFKAFATPLPGEEPRGKLTTSTAEVTSFEERDWTPDRDIVLTWRAAADAPRNRVLRAGDFYLAALRPAVSSANRQPPAAYRFYIDTSASSAEGAVHRIRALERILAALPAGDPVQLMAFDNEVVPLASGTASEMSRRVEDLLRARLFLGGTDLSAVVADATRALRSDPSRAIVIASDMVPTLGETNVPTLPAGATVHALILGSREDAPTAKRLTAGRGRIIRVPFTDSIDTDARAAAEDLRRPLGASVDFSDPAAEWIYPAHFDDVREGEELFVLGKVKAGQEPRVANVAAQRLEAATFAPLLEREAYRAYLNRLAEREATETEEGVRRALAAEQVRISVEQRVVIPRTTMLVLESEWDYQRFGLDRRALAAILTVDAGGIGRVDRTPLPPRRPEPVPVPMPTARERVNATPDAVPEPKAARAPATVAESVTITQQAPMIAPAPPQQDFAAEPPQRVAPPPPPPPAPAPVPPPSPAPVPVPPPREEARRVAPPQQRNEWWKNREIPPRARIAELESQLKADPRDRELYNQLSEALAAHGEWPALRALALRWQPYDPENPQVYEVLGLAGEQLGKDAEAARAFASLIEIAPAKTELLQRAGLLLLRANRAKLAEGPLRKALEVRPDRANGYRHLALMLWQDGRPEEAARVLESATRQNFPQWYGNVQRVIREELGYVYRAWQAKDPSRRGEIADRAREHDVDLARTDALRVTLAWETDANDVDLHVVDPSGEECYYSHASTRSGLQLYGDITQGLGPEVIRTGNVDRGTYHIGVRYFAAGPMGISRGLVVVIRNDQIAIHPFRLVQGGREIRYVAAVNVK